MEKKFYRVTFEVEAYSKRDVDRLFEDVVNTDRAEILNESVDNTAEELKVRIGYVKSKDSFDLFISSDGGDSWGMSVSSTCRRCEGQDPDAEPEFVHIGLIEELKRALALGYRAVY